MSDQYTRRCDGNCSFTDPHDSHLTAAGRERFAGGQEDEKNIFAECNSIRQVLNELTGFGSVCWKDEREESAESVEIYRVFDSELATKASNDAFIRILELVKELPSVLSVE